MKQGLGKGYLRLFVRAAVFLLILYLVFTRVLFLGRVTGMEMYPSLKDGDLALGYRLEREYRTGDVIVYEAGGALHFGRVAVKEEENTDHSVLTLKGNDFEAIQKLYDRSQNRYLDIGHLEVIIMGNELMESGRWEDFLNYLKMEPLAGENIYLFRTEDPEVVLKWDSGGASIGDYLTGLLENRVPAQQKEGVTLRQVYHQWYQDRTLLALPQITLVDGELEVFLE